MEKLYYGGNIITMKDESDAVEAVLVKDGKILFCGDCSEAEKMCTDSTEKINLEGRTLMPSFIDPHGHISMMAQFSAFCDLSECNCFDDVTAELKKWKEEKQIGADDVIIGCNYDHNFLIEQRHITRDELDEVSTDIPIFVLHTSGHMGVGNSRMLELAEIDDSTPDPYGGKFGRDDNGRLTGYVEESPALTIVLMKAYQRYQGDLSKQMVDAQNTYFKYGITTVQDGATAMLTLQGLTAAAKAGLYKLDVVSYVMTEDFEKAREEYPEFYGKYSGRLKIGGAKIVLDGSPQGKSAWLSRPYEGEGDYCAYPTHTTEEVEEASLNAVKGNYQLLAHCNGDAASQQFIESYKKALDIAGTAEKMDLRPVMIHCQTVREDQLDEMAKLRMIPSIFVAHTFYWGDIHLKNLGAERGNRISPVRSAMEKGLVYNFHQDSPVVKPDVMHTVWCAVNRITRNGQHIGTEQTIDVYDALKGVTINCAYEYHEEDIKGSIEEGKLADLVILDKNPLTVDKMSIRDIKVLETIKEGNTVYKK